MGETGVGELASIFRELKDMNFPLIVLVVLIAWLLILLVRRVLPFLAGRLPGSVRHSILPWIPLLRLVIMAVAMAVVLPFVVTPTPQNLIVIFGSAGVAVGFALKDYVSSLIAGIVAVFEKPYRVGDRVKIDDVYGEVTLIGFRMMRLVTPDDTMVTIPHAKIWNTNVHNANDGKRDLLCVAEFYLHPDHDPAVVRNRLLDVALTSPYLEIGKPVTVIILEKPWYTQYRLKAYAVDGREEFHFITDLTVRGKQALAELGVKPAVIPAAVG